MGHVGVGEAQGLGPDGVVDDDRDGRNGRRGRVAGRIDFAGQGWCGEGEGEAGWRESDQGEESGGQGRGRDREVGCLRGGEAWGGRGR